MKLYQDSNGIWHYDTTTLVAGDLRLKDMGEEGIHLYWGNSKQPIFRGDVGELKREDGSPYEDVETLLTECKDFFVNPLNPLAEEVEGLKESKQDKLPIDEEYGDESKVLNEVGEFKQLAHADLVSSTLNSDSNHLHITQEEKDSFALHGYAENETAKTLKEIGNEVNSLQDDLGSIEGVATKTSSSPYIELIDDTKDFKQGLLDGMSIKIAKGETEYDTTVVASDGDTIHVVPLLLPISSKAIVGSGEDGEGQVTIEYIGELEGAAGNDVTVEFVQGSDDSGVDTVSYDDATKTLTYICDSDGMSNPRELLAGNIETKINETAEVNTLFFASNVTPGEILFDEYEFLGGVDGIKIVGGDKYKILNVLPGLMDRVVDLETLVIDRLNTTYGIWVGTQEEYEELEEYYPNVLYHITELE